MIAACSLFLQVAAKPLKSLDEYLKLDTGKPSWTVGPKSTGLIELRLNGLTWQGDL